MARLLVARGAVVDAAWLAAALGLLDRLDAILDANPPPADVSQAFWHACAARPAPVRGVPAGRGADLNWEPDYAHGTPLDAAAAARTAEQALARGGQYGLEGFEYYGLQADSSAALVIGAGCDKRQ